MLYRTNLYSVSTENLGSWFRYTNIIESQNRRFKSKDEYERDFFWREKELLIDYLIVLLRSLKKGCFTDSIEDCLIHLFDCNDYDFINNDKYMKKFFLETKKKIGIE